MSEKLWIDYVRDKEQKLAEKQNATKPTKPLSFEFNPRVTPSVCRDMPGEEALTEALSHARIGVTSLSQSQPAGIMRWLS